MNGFANVMQWHDWWRLCALEHWLARYSFSRLCVTIARAWRLGSREKLWTVKKATCLNFFRSHYIFLFSVTTIIINYFYFQFYLFGRRDVKLHGFKLLQSRMQTPQKGNSHAQFHRHTVLKHDKNCSNTQTLYIDDCSSTISHETRDLHQTYSVSDKPGSYLLFLQYAAILRAVLHVGL